MFGRTRAIVGILAALLVGAACGDDDSTPTDVPNEGSDVVEGGADADADGTDVGSDADADADADVPAEADADAGADTGADADAVADDGGDPDASSLLTEIAGTWHGMIGPGYRNGCLCLTLDGAGNVIEPSGITMGFDVDGGATTIVDPGTREIDIRMFVTGAPFHVQDAFVNGGATIIDGQWVGETFHDFDDTIVLDREPQSCEARTGLTGAPC